MPAGADTGGTFTDLVAADGRSVKVPTTPHDPAEAVQRGLALLGASPLDVLCHGTTVATNALLERRGAPVALVTNEGFEDLIEIARQVRPSLYDQWADRPPPLVPRELRVGVAGRLGPDGTELAPVGEPHVPGDVAAVAVVLLHADVNPAHERAVADRLRTAGHDVVCSHEVSPEFREYERTVTTVVDAYLRPVCRSYLRRVAGLADEVLVMTSAGGLVPAAVAAERPAALVLSGPAGGVRAAAAAAAAAGFPDAVTFDMGGTSTDVCLVVGGVPEPAAERVVGGLAIRLPALDVHTIGAGGGSVAYLDAGGALRVGPRSAGAVPGPACYGRGGVEPTVTDADLLLGRIPAGAPLGGIGPLDVAAARRAVATLGPGVTPAGIVAVVDAAMEEAVRVVTVARGVDPRDLALVAFGGAGPLHACAVAGALGMRVVVVPPRAGVLSAAGVLCAPRQRDLVRSWPRPDDLDGLAPALDSLAREAARLVGPGATTTTAVDCRYPGQSHEITVATVEAFHDEHRRRNGWARPGAPVEVVAIRARATAPPPVDAAALPTSGLHRRPTEGPAVVAEPDCTVWVPPGWRADVAESGAWILRPSRS
jgi:N-methylhydantoinase A/oxoprolinase/acetone carboxylase beta subunit